MNTPTLSPEAWRLLADMRGHMDDEMPTEYEDDKWHGTEELESAGLIVVFGAALWDYWTHLTDLGRTIEIPEEYK